MSARTKDRASDYAMSAKRYAEQVVAGEILACRWVQRACQRQLDDLAKFKGKASPYLFNPKLTDKDGRNFQPADNLCAFIERLPHVKGPLAGEPIHLEPWQAFILTTVFGWVKPNGTRRFRRSYIEVPRGNAKSTLSSAVALYMLAADREGGAEVYSLATTRDQARIVFGDAQTMARRSPGFRRRFSVEVGAHNMHVLASGSKFEALSAEGSTLDGLNIHFGCVDELHAHKTRTVYDVVETGTGKRDNSLLWVITTAGSNRAGICYDWYAEDFRLGHQGIYSLHGLAARFADALADVEADRARIRSTQVLITYLDYDWRLNDAKGTP